MDSSKEKKRDEHIGNDDFIMKKNQIVLSVILVFIFVLTGCSSSASKDSGDDTASGDIVLRAASQTDYPPFCYTDEEGNHTGFDVELLRLIDERLDGYTIDIQSGTWESMFLSIDSKRLDLVADEIAVTQDREEKYLFSEPYIEIQSVIVSQKGRTDIQSLDDLAGKRVVATVDSYSLLLEQYNETHEEQINIEYISSEVDPSGILTQVAQGKYDAYVNDPVMMNAVITEYGIDAEVVGEPLVVEPAAILLAKDEDGEAIKALIDPIIRELKEDGTLSALSVKWTGGDYVPE